MPSIFTQRLLFLLILIGLSTACRQEEVRKHSPEKELPVNSFIQLEELEEYFQKDSLIGHFLLYDLQEDQYALYNDSVLNTSFTPASTFKIFNSLVALETGIIKDTNQVLQWDGRDRGWRHWNKNQTIKTAVRYSALWFFQRIALAVFEKDSSLYQQYLSQASYGNQQHSAQQDLFWLDNSLQISPQQQIDFLVKFYKGDLPFSQKHIQTTKEIIQVEKTDSYALYAKTGLGIVDENYVGWYVGFVESNDKVVFFCTNIRNTKPIKSIMDFRNQYIGITRQILTKLAIAPLIKNSLN